MSEDKESRKPSLGLDLDLTPNNSPTVPILLHEGRALSFLQTGVMNRRDELR